MNYVYVIRDKDGKCYVGQAEKPFRRWSAHVKNAYRGGTTRIQVAIREQGLLAFTFQVVSEHQTIDEAYRAEVEAIKTYDSYGESGYNDTLGGEGIVGFKPSKESRLKMSQARIGKVNSPETRKKISIANKGKQYSEETKRKLSESNRGKHDHRGERHPSATLSDEQAIEIRKLWHSCTVTRDELCRRYGIHRWVLNTLLNGDTYAHLPLRP